MQKILLVDFAFIGLSGGGHSESYLMKILSILTSNHYYVYLCSGNNEQLKENIARENVSNCQVVNLNLKFIDKVIRHLLLKIDTFLSYFDQSRWLQFSSLINLFSVQRLISDLGEDIAVFFAHTDSMMPAVPTAITRFLMPRRWVGLCILPSYQSKVVFGLQQSRRTFRAEKNFGLPSCKAILVLHPIYQTFFSKRFKNLSCFYLPELVDINRSDIKPVGSNTEDINLDLLRQIHEKAKGRKIISMLGNITPRKNLSLFLQSITQVNPLKCFVVVLGRLKIGDKILYLKEADRVDFYKRELKENSWIDIEYYIKSEQEFYALIQLSDILFLHYDKHPFSSNVLAKAIASKKPVIVNKGYLMEKTVNRYNWTTAVDQDSDRIAQKIEELIDSGFKVDENHYLSFMYNHSPQQFEAAILQACETLRG